MSKKNLPAERQAFGAAEQALPAIPRRRAMRVGFIGLDPIGRTMASRLLKAGHQLTLYDPVREIPESLESAGGKVANSVQDACRWADAVFTMLPTDEVAETLILGPGGVAQSLPEESWVRASAGTGSKGERLYDWARVALPESEAYCEGVRAGRWSHRA